MDRKSLLLQIKRHLENFKVILKDNKVADDIGYKPILADLVSMGTFILACESENENSFQEAELYIFLGLCVGAKELRNPSFNIDMRKQEMKTITERLAQEKEDLSILWGYVAKSSAPIEPERTIPEQTPNKEESLDNATVLQFDDFLIQKDLDVLKQEMEMCSVNYVMNRNRLDKLGFSAYGEEIYSLVASWCGQASDLAENLIKERATTRSNYTSKFLRNATVLTKMMSLTLQSLDAETLKSRIEALEANLVQMDQYYKPLKKVK